MDHPPRKSRVLKWSVTIGIVIVLNLLFNYSLSLIYPAPDYQTYCPNAQINIPPATKEECISIGGQWNETTYPQQSTTTTSKISTPKPVETGYCDPTFTCQKTFDAVNKTYEKNIFIALVILGVISILIGLFLKVTDAVTIGFSLGGILSLIIASVRYWSEAENILKVIILAVALIALVWVGIKKFQD